MGKVVHGARVKVVFEGVELGVLTNITEREDYGLQPVYGIGHLTPQEIVALRFSGNFDYASLVLSVDKVKNLKYAERSGKTVQDIVKAILTQEGFSIVIEDKYSGNNISTISNCKMGSLNLTVSENAVIQRNGSGMYGDPVVAP